MPSYSHVSETMPLWISWRSKHIAVGQGVNPPQHTLLEFYPLDDVFYNIQAVSLRSIGTSGVWTIDKLSGVYFSCVSWVSTTKQPESTKPNLTCHKFNQIDQN